MTDSFEMPMMAVWGARTVWRLKAIPSWPTYLDVQVVVDTTAPMVVKAIEQAAEAHGIELEKIEETGAVNAGR
jgi:hypothetical protein